MSKTPVTARLVTLAILGACLMGWQGSAHAATCAGEDDPACAGILGQVSVIAAEHRACGEDRDCVLVYRACCPCGGDDRADAVNARFVKQYEYVCSKAEIRACAQQGACAQRAVASPVCRRHSCGVELQPVNR